MKQPTRSSRGRAFTLIELLVVIAIIAILAGILFPVFAQAKESAKQVACATQMRQVGIALDLYRTDHDDFWCPIVEEADSAGGYPPQEPWIGYDNSNTSGTVNGGFFGSVLQPAARRPRAGLIDPYLKDEKIKRCPSMPPQWQLAIAYNLFNPGIPSDYYARNPDAAGNEYGPGARLTWQAASGGLSAQGASDSEMQEPSNTLVAWEHEAAAPGCNWLQRGDWFIGPPADKALSDHFHFLHREGSNTLWGDGHVKRVQYSQLKRPWFSMRKDIYPSW